MTGEPSTDEPGGGAPRPERRYGVAPRAEALAMTGRAFLEAMRDGRMPLPPIAGLLRYELVEVGDGFAAFEGEPDPSVYNIMGTVHGGWSMTLLDSVLACAIHSTLPPGASCPTLETKVNFVRPLMAGTRVRAEGRIVSVGRRVGLAQGEIKDVQGKVIAYGTSTCMVVTE